MSGSAPELVTELLTGTHETTELDSGEDETDSWLRSNALRAQQHGSARTRVLVRAGSRRVLGLYALTPHDTHREDVPNAAAGGCGWSLGTSSPSWRWTRASRDRA